MTHLRRHSHAWKALIYHRVIRISDHLMDLDRLRRRVRLRDLETLAAVVEAGGMRKAAEALHISQPAVSRAIRDLEEKLGVQLLQRGRRGVELTHFGEAL